MFSTKNSVYFPLFSLHLKQQFTFLEICVSGRSIILNNLDDFIVHYYKALQYCNVKKYTVYVVDSNFLDLYSVQLDDPSPPHSYTV